jgi:hypothetical protein
LHHDQQKCAQMHNDKHLVKMILEYAQLLSTSHRVLDGIQVTEKSKTNRKVKRWKLADARDTNIYTATHINHPSAVWARSGSDNYAWLVQLWLELMSEYTYRYGKQHACERLIPDLTPLPTNIPNRPFSEPTPAMPEELRIPGDSLASYRNYYINGKKHLASWKGKTNSREIPDWYK